jgi:hypothetical protein
MTLLFPSEALSKSRHRLDLDARGHRRDAERV